jgi:hypothetical protein
MPRGLRINKEYCKKTNNTALDAETNSEFAISLAGSGRTLEESAKKIAGSERKVAHEMKTVASDAEKNSESAMKVATKVADCCFSLREQV